MDIINNKNKSNLFLGMLIGSVAGIACGALVTNFFAKLAGKAWLRVTHREPNHEVDPRWLLQ